MMKRFYYFKHAGVSAFDVQLEANYLFHLGEKVRLYPLAGICLGIWHAHGVDVSVAGYKFSSDSQTDSKIGANLVGGFEYPLNDYWGFNAEVKYQIISHASQVGFGLVASYRF